MFKMRVNSRKLTIISVITFFIWLIFAFTSHNFSLAKSRPSSKNVLDIQNRILDLEKQMDNRLTESEKLLHVVHDQFKTMHQPVGKGDDGASWSDGDYQDLQNSGPTVLPVLVIACDRVTIKRCIENLVKFRPNSDIFPIIVSQDCGHNGTYNVIKSFVDADPSIQVVRQPDQSEITLPKPMVKFRGYYKIARHFRFALNYVLVKLGYKAVIVVEDDLDISPDFYEYFLGTYPLLRKDRSIWCISAWNDNGKKGLIDQNHPELLHRTDFFPGLGWMMTQDTWGSLEPHWPEAFFDDWLRDPKNTHNRACIRPEISRTYSFGKVGVSKGLFFDMHLRYIQLNLSPVSFTKHNLTYLMKDVYDDRLSKTVDSAVAMTAQQVMSAPRNGGRDPVKVVYSDAKSYQKAAKALGLMDDFRSGIPRTGYQGIVTCFIKGRRVYLVPEFKWTKYDPNWG